VHLQNSASGAMLCTGSGRRFGKPPPSWRW
jgi:hypothetical protein